MLYYSPLPFYAADRPLPPEAALAFPLPIVPGDRFLLQSSLARNVGPHSTLPRLAWVTPGPNHTYLLQRDNLLPLVYHPAQRRVAINLNPQQPFPDVPLGIGHLALVNATGIWAVSPPLQVYAAIPPATRLVRYRSLQTSVFFDYSDPLIFNQFRLPIRVDRPQYPLTPIPNFDPVTGQNTPLNQRIDKEFELRSAWLTLPQLEALQIALRHDNFELWVPNDPDDPTLDGTWQPLYLDGQAPITWAPDPDLPIGQLSARLRPFDFGALNAMFTIPLFRD